MRLAVLLIVVISISPFCLAQTTWYVPDDFTTIQGAISDPSLVDGDTVIVRPGTYVENIDFVGKAITVKSSDGAEATIIDGGSPSNPDFGSVVSFNNGEGVDSVLEAFTLTNGRGSYVEHIPGSWRYCGGGILCVGSSPTITKTTITGNTSDSGVYGFGGGIYCNNHASPTITNTRIIGNTAGSDGGGISCNNNSSPTIKNITITGNKVLGGSGSGISCNNYSTPTITNTTINDNTGHGVGGGISCSYSSPTIENTTIIGNTITNYGGGIFCYEYSSPTITNTTITGNKVTIHGGGIYCNDNSSPTITNTTIIGNTVDYYGGGIYCYCFSSPTLSNTILWNNTASKGPEIWVGDSTDPSTLTISYSDVKGGMASVFVDPGSTLNWGAGMINADPYFVDSIQGDFHIWHASPCKDAGDNGAPCLPMEDFEGDPRIAYNTVDIGADEFYPHIYITGNKTPGGAVQLKLTGVPGTNPVAFFIGTSLWDPPLNWWPYGYWYLNDNVEGPFMMGTIPWFVGVQVLSDKIPVTIPAPYTVYLHGIIGSTSTNIEVLNVE